MRALLVVLTQFCLLIKLRCVVGFNASVSVVEYMYQFDQRLSPEENLMKNVRAHVSIIRLLKGKSELVVFPESSLTPSIKNVGVYMTLPPPSYSAPTIENKGLKQIATAAATSNMYVVVNVPEKAGKSRYSTTIVFRRNGTVAASYRKYHLSGEDVDKPATPQSVYFDTDFGPRFGIISSLDIMFDKPAHDLIQSGIKYFVYPTRWTSSLPFLIGNQVQHSWSWKHDITLLAAGLNRVELGQSGSGIFKGRAGHLSESPYDYYTANSPTTLLITSTMQSFKPRSQRPAIDKPSFQGVYNYKKFADRGKNVSSIFSANMNEVEMKAFATNRVLNLGESEFSSLSTLLSPNGSCVRQMSGNSEYYRCQTQDEVRNGNVVCSFNLTTDYFVCSDPCDADKINPNIVLDDSFYLFRYRLSAVDGLVSPWKGGGKFGMQSCSVVPCLDEDIASCYKKPDASRMKINTYTLGGRSTSVWAQSITSVSITAKFNGSSGQVTPTLFLGEIEPSMTEYKRFGLLSNHFLFEEEESFSRLILPEQIRNLATVGIVKRIFREDVQPRNSATNLSTTLVEILLLITFVQYLSKS